MARCPITPNGKHIPGCGCEEEPAPAGRAKKTTGVYTCCGGTASHRRNCKTLNTPKPVNARGPERKVCGITWQTTGSAHVHICGKKPHGNREKHVCEHAFCFALPPHATSGKPGKEDDPGSKPPAAASSKCRRCGGNQKIPGPNRTWIQCPSCKGTGTR